MSAAEVSIPNPSVRRTTSSPSTFHSLTVRQLQTQHIHILDCRELTQIVFVSRARLTSESASFAHQLAGNQNTIRFSLHVLTSLSFQSELAMLLYYACKDMKTVRPLDRLFQSSDQALSIFSGMFALEQHATIHIQPRVPSSFVQS